MSDSYPELNRAQSLIKETLRMEEEKFLVLLDRGIKILNDEISKIDKILPGELAKGLEILAGGGDIDYQGATDVELSTFGDAAGSFKEMEVKGGAFELVQVRQ